MSLKAFAWLFGSLLLLALGLASYLITRGDETSSSELNATHPIVTIPQGKLQGYTMLTSENRTVYTFLGVPYAQPPVGDLRFKPPVPPTTWNGTLNASRMNSVCLQPARKKVIGSEDCLYLEIYTPKLPSSKNSTLLPVMFFIIGGGFKTAMPVPTRYGPDFLLNEDVILVIPTFRVGALGFLSTGDEVLPGNYGLKDVVQALKWVQKNIKYFGGDPDRVTAAGASTGGMIVSLLTLTNVTKGLFHRYITQSGSALVPLVLEPKEVYANRAKQLGEHLGCPTNKSILLVDCLRGVNGSDLTKNSEIFFNWKTWPINSLHATIERDIEGAILTKSSTRLVAEGKGLDLPWLNSNVGDEGLVFTRKLSLNSTLLEEVFDNIDAALPEMADYSLAASNVTAYTEALKAYYFPDLTANRTLLLKNLTHLISDFEIMYPTYRILQQRLAVGKSPMYHCSFEYRGTLAYSYYYTGGKTNHTGAWHGDECIYLFRDKENLFAPPQYDYSKDDLVMVKKMVKMWTSFAINGEPTPADENGEILWKPYSGWQNYLQIGDGSKTELTVKYRLRKEQMEFIDQLIAKIPWL